MHYLPLQSNGGANLAAQLVTATTPTRPGLTLAGTAHHQGRVRRPFFAIFHFFAKMLNDESTGISYSLGYRIHHRQGALLSKECASLIVVNNLSLLFII